MSLSHDSRASFTETLLENKPNMTELKLDAAQIPRASLESHVSLVSAMMGLHQFYPSQYSR